MNGRIFKIGNQKDAYTTPWPLAVRMKVLLWNIAWLLFFRPCPKYLYQWRNFLLQIFGCKIDGTPYVAPNAKIKMPWNLSLEDKACLGPESEVYNLGPVILKSRCTISQQVYLCITGPRLYTSLSGPKQALKIKIYL